VPVWDAIVVAGGRGRRLGGKDKPALELAGRSLLDIALDAARAARAIVVVGPRRPVGMAVTWAREEPAGGGPLAALAAGLRALPPGSGVVTVLAADLPAIEAGTIHALLRTIDDADGAVAVDSTGRAQPLLAAYRTAALRRALATIGEPHGQPMRRLLDTLDLARLEVGSAAEDIDTPGDLARWQEGRP
jgi:molybdopterin-guanine dinucleotide biosynthesis protein A